MDALRLVYRAPHRQAALEAFRGFKQAWAALYPTIVACVEEDLGHLLAFYDCPELHREYVRANCKTPVDQMSAATCSVESRAAHYIWYWRGGVSPFCNWLVRTSNPIERLFVELRRARFAAGAFANPISCDRVVAGVYIRMNAQWADEDIWYVRLRRRRKLKAKAAEAQGAGEDRAESSRYASAA